MTLEQLVPDLATSQQLKEAGFPQDTALAWYPEHCDDYEAEAPASLWPDEWKRIAEGQPVVCVREEMEDHESLCAAPTAGEMMKWIRAKHPDAEITSRYVWPGAAWIVRYRDDSFKNAHSDTEIAALAALVLEVAG